MESKDLSLAIGKTCHELPRVAAVPKGLFMQFYFICSFDRFEVGYDHRAASQIREWLNAAKSLRFNWVLCIQETPGEGPSGLGLLTQKTPTSYLYIYIYNFMKHHQESHSMIELLQYLQLPDSSQGSCMAHGFHIFTDPALPPTSLRGPPGRRSPAGSASPWSAARSEPRHPRAWAPAALSRRC